MTLEQPGLGSDPPNESGWERGATQNPGILAFEGNPTSYVQADGNEYMPLVLNDWKPWSGLGPDSLDPDSLDPILEILME